MAAKLTLVEIKSRLRRISPKIKIISTRYRNNQAPMKCLCLRCGCKWLARWGHLQQGHGCPPCGNLAQHAAFRLTTAEVVNRLRKISPEIKVIGEYPGNNRAPMGCLCLKCGHKWSPMWMVLQQGRGCPKCAGILKPTTERINSTAQELGISVIGEYPGNNRAPMGCLCLKCGHKWSPMWITLNRGGGCPMCSRQRANGQRRLTIEEVRRKLKRINPAIEVIRVYHGDNSLIPNSEVGQAHLRRNEKHRRSRLWVKCRCRQCNHIWSPSWDSLCHNKSGCPQCGALKSEEEVRSTLEKLTGLKWPRANPTDAPFLHGLTLDGYCRELRSPKFPNGTAFERQGEQHYYLCRWNRWDSKKLLQQKRRDKRKRMQCWRHGVRLIRIPYWVKDVGGYLKQKLVKGQVRSPR